MIGEKKNKFLSSQLSALSSKFVIGLNSGTSFDGVDIALVKFQKGNLKPYFVDGFVYKYPKQIKEGIRKLINVETLHGVSLQEISQLNFQLGEIFANAVLKIIKKNKLKHNDVLLIASHGQTIFHCGGKYTFQIGESAVIAQRTRIKTVSNFREGDIAVSGQGAPLMPFLDWVLFNKSKNIKAVINVGGISNIAVVGKNISPIAFDMGPGNALIDLIAKKYFKKDFDKEGKLAARGEINFKLVDKTLNDPYFKLRPPKSTGKEYFNEAFIKRYFSQIKNKQDTIATVTYFSAKVIEKAFKDFIFPKHDVKEVIISGGGVKNKTLMNHLKKLFVGACHGKLLATSDKYGIPSKYKEAILFALLGYTCYKNIPNNIPSCTGAKKKVVLGKSVKC